MATHGAAHAMYSPYTTPCVPVRALGLSRDSRLAAMPAIHVVGLSLSLSAGQRAVISLFPSDTFMMHGLQWFIACETIISKQFMSQCLQWSLRMPTHRDALLRADIRTDARSVLILARGMPQSCELIPAHNKRFHPYCR
jgi:hypothetical protein